MTQSSQLLPHLHKRKDCCYLAICEQTNTNVWII